MTARRHGSKVAQFLIASTASFDTVKISLISLERRGVHEVEHWTRDAQLLLMASHK